MSRQLDLIFLLIVTIILVACQTNNSDSSDSKSEIRSIEAEAMSEGVYRVRGGQREALSAEEPIKLGFGEGVAVEETGRVALRWTDLLTAELLQAGEVVLADSATNDDEITTLTLHQNGGILLGDFNPDEQDDRDLIIETEFATFTTGGTRFMLVREVNSPLEWVVNLGAADKVIQVTAAGQTRIVVGGQARWVAPDDVPGEAFEIETRRLQAWYNSTKSGEAELTLSEVLLAPANMIGTTTSLPALPRLGQPFELSRSEQGAVKLRLDPVGIFGNPSYTLEDCNADGTPDIVIRAGKVLFDFRSLLARALALDVSVVNRDPPDSGAVWALDATGQELDRDLLQVSSGQSDTLSLRSDRPFYRAELALNNGCFTGFSLTPPTATGQASEPRAAVTAQPGDVVVNILAEPEQERASSGEIEAWPVGRDGETPTIQIDGERDDWNTLFQQSDLDWTNFEAITYDTGCDNHYPSSEATTDLAGKVGFAYDARYLYVAFRVEDDGYVGYTGGGENFFQGDSPQLSLDMDLPGDFNEAVRNGDDWQVDFLPDKESPQAALWQLGSLTSRRFDEAQVAVTATETGYFLEAALPWPAFDAVPQPGDRLGIAANVNDNDTPGTNAQECIISTAPERKWDTPTTWGTLLLRPTP